MLSKYIGKGHHLIGDLVDGRAIERDRVVVEQRDDVDEGRAQDRREDALSDVDGAFDQGTILIAGSLVD